MHRQDRDAVSVACVLVQLVAVDGRQLRLVSKVEDSHLRVEVKDGRYLWILEIEIYQQRSRPRCEHRSEAHGDRGSSVGPRREDSENGHPAAPPAGMPCCTSPGCIVARTIPPWSAYQTTCGKNLVGIQSSADPWPARRTRTSCM